MRTAFLRSLLMVAGMGIVAGCTRVEPDEIGIRTINLGKGKGIVEKDYGPGYHRYLWPLDTWNRFPSTVQRVLFAKELPAAPVPSAGPLQLTSADGDKVVLYAEVFFRIADNRAHRVLQDSGPGERYKEIVRGLAPDTARALFGRLRTEAFYDEKSRETVREQAVALLRERLSARGIELIDFLVESVEFDPNYENLIKKKKIADQRVELEKAKGKAATEQGRVARITVETTAKVQKVDRETEGEVTRRTAETDYQISTLKAEADKYAVERRADATLHQSQREAEGQRLLKSAEAEGTQRLNEALVGDGGRNLVALEAVKKLNLSEVTFPSLGFEWFNPYEMAARLGATEAPERSSDTKKKQ